MIHYVVLNNWNNLPTFEDLVAHVFNESFRRRKDLGFAYSYNKKTGEPNFVMLRWPKFKENPNCPHYMSTSVVRIVFSPFNIPHSKVIRKEAKKIGLPNVIQISTSSWSMPAMIDHRIFYRAVHLLAKSTNGMVFENSKLKPITAEQYHRKHIKIIQYPFHLKLTKSDIVRVPSNTY